MRSINQGKRKKRCFGAVCGKESMKEIIRREAHNSLSSAE